MALASARIGAIRAISAAARSTPGSPVAKASRQKACTAAWAPASCGRSARQVLGEASASLMKVMTTIARVMAASRATAASKPVCGASRWATAMIATV
ncbi:hypothetical protein MET9862_04858 [Methylobacterium symbioticum]|uniref:Uncharacterized protein n=1 Tax=Methylobacterium symbioticum TaxID=2584084 RepID=A0A509EJ99_9HYPH|nr:hypothetical protein MET9862_04858 [Methylobacterium symbioticum]